MVFFLLFLLLSQVGLAYSQDSHAIDMRGVFQRLETQYHRQLGVYALDTNSGKVIGYRERQRFPFQSSFKLFGVAALLYQHQKTPLLHETVKIEASDRVPWGPVSGLYVNKPVSYAALAEAAVSYSDNTAINLIIRKLSGIEAINRFVHRLGNRSFRLGHIENHLNSRLELRVDTSTPKDMAKSLRTLFHSTILNKKNRQRLKTWLWHNTTGYDRIRAGVPLGWSVADKTGSGHYGVANDLGFVWSPGCKPVFLAIYTAGAKQADLPSSRLVAEATRQVLHAFSQNQACYRLTDISVMFKKGKT